MSKEYINSKNFLCGVIEGFYGRPWTTVQRKQLFMRMRLMGLNSYMYAPKDDLKHRQMWREMYTVEEADEIQCLIQSAKSNGIRFIYAISPGLDIVFSNEKDVKTLKKKLETILEMGCDSFAILFDDIEAQLCAIDREKYLSYGEPQVNLTNEIFQHLGSPDCFLFCPTEYCATRAIPNVSKSVYLNMVGSKLFPGIDVMWTGPKVIPKDIPLETIKELAVVLRRAPIIWDNLHANDYDQKRLFMGPYKGRNPQLIPYLRGVMTNPNCEFESNFIAMYTLAQWSRCLLVESTNNNDDSSDIYQPRRVLVNALKEWLTIINQSEDSSVNNSQPLNDIQMNYEIDASVVRSFSVSSQDSEISAPKTDPISMQLIQTQSSDSHQTVRNRKSVGKGLLAVAKGSFPVHTAQELARLSQSAVTICSRTQPVQISASPFVPIHLNADGNPVLHFSGLNSMVNLANPAETRSLKTSSDSCLEPQQINSHPAMMQLMASKPDIEMTYSALQTAAVVAQVIATEDNLKSLQQNTTLVPPNFFNSIDNTGPNDNQPVADLQRMFDSETEVFPALPKQNSVSLLSSTLNPICTNSNETSIINMPLINSIYPNEDQDAAHLLQMQNDLSLLPALASTPAIIASIEPSELPNPLFLKNFPDSIKENSETISLNAEPSSTLLLLPSDGVDRAEYMVAAAVVASADSSSATMAGENQQLVNSDVLLPGPMETDSEHSNCNDDTLLFQPQEQMELGQNIFGKTTIVENENIKSHEADEEDNFTVSSQVFNLEDLQLLIDMFYLPFEFGPSATYLLDLLYWLRFNAGSTSLCESTEQFSSTQSELNIPTFQSILLDDDNSRVVSRNEWLARKQELTKIIHSVYQLCDKVNSLPNRAFFFDLYPYLWDVRTLLSMLETYFDWLADCCIDLGQSTQLRHSLLWGTPGYKLSFQSGEHEPWFFRGGLTAELQRMLPLDGCTDLLPTRLPPPTIPDTGQLISPLVNTLRVRHVQKSNSSELAAMFQLCRRITWLRTHLDLCQISGRSVDQTIGLGLEQDFFARHNMDDLPGDRFLLGFIELSPQHCFLVEDIQTGDIFGYAFAVINAQDWFQKMRLKILPNVLSKYKTILSQNSLLKHIKIRESSDFVPDDDTMDVVTAFNRQRVELIDEQQFENKSNQLATEEDYFTNIIQDYFDWIYFHANPNSMKHTLEEVDEADDDEVEDEVLTAQPPHEESLDSLNLRMDLESLHNTYPALVTIDFLPSRDVMLWHDDVAKRLLANLLATLRSKGVTGVHCRLPCNSWSHIAFYKRYRFESVNLLNPSSTDVSEKCDNHSQFSTITNDIFLVRHI